MNGKIILLPGMKFVSGSILYRAGEVLPDTESTRALVRKKKAVWQEETPEVDASSVSETDGYEKQRVKDLTDIAKARGVDLPSGANKAQTIGLLRAWDVKNDGVS